MTPRRRLVAVTAVVTSLALLAAACSNTTGLPAAFFTNVVDTVSLYALRGTAITLPSAYSLQDTARVRTDTTVSLDFAFDFDSTGKPVFLPTAALHLGTASGLQRTSTAFGAITLAPSGGYILDSAMTVDTGTVLYAVSRPVTCLIGAVPLYAKLHVLSVDTAARRLDFEILVDLNCGYRGLAPGPPPQQPGRAALARRGHPSLTRLLDELEALDMRRRALTGQLDQLKGERNEAAKSDARLMKEKGELQAAVREGRRALGQRIETLEAELRGIEAAVEDKLLYVPNLPLADVPDGDESHNKVVRTWGEPAPRGGKPHWELGETLGLLDLARGAKISGSGFPVFVGAGSKLVRGHP